MQETAVAWGSFPSRKAADQAVQRLVQSGFARNSIDLHRHDDDEGYDLAVHTRQHNLDRVQRLIEASPARFALQKMGSGAVRNARSHPIALAGAGIVAAVVLYAVLQGRRQPDLQRGRRAPREGR